MNTQSELFVEEQPSRFSLPDAQIDYWPNFFSPEDSGRLLPTLIESIPWKQNKIRFYGKESLVPRLESWHGDPGICYAYSGIQMKAKPWTQELLEIKNRIEKKSGTGFNSVLINYYRDGKDRVAWHSDDEKELGKNPIIASVSFGAERRFRLKHKTHKNLKHDITLQDGSLLLMKGGTQHHWLHQVPKTKKNVGERINLTFRLLK